MARGACADTLNNRACEDVGGSVGTIVRNQWIRSTMSVPANVAEGSAKRSDREFARFVRIALGSATEAENHMILAYDLGLIQQQQYDGMTSRSRMFRKCSPAWSENSHPMHPL